jgi:hypothetical protein
LEEHQKGVFLSGTHIWRRWDMWRRSELSPKEISFLAPEQNLQSLSQGGK